MKKKLTIVVTVIMMLAVAVPAAFAALSDTQQKKVDDIYRQMAELRKQLIQQYVDAGQITPEQGKALQERQAGSGYGCGFGRGRGAGMGPGAGLGACTEVGPGRGFGCGSGTPGSCGNCPLNSNVPDPGASTGSNTPPAAGTSL